MNKISEFIWCKEISLNVLGIPIGGRSVIVKLPSQKILIYSPLEFTTHEVEGIHKWGEVEYLLAPNAFHHLFLEKAREHFPKAKVMASAGLQKKRPNWSFANWISEQSKALDFQDFQIYPLQGHGAQEFEVYIPQYKTLLIADLFFNLNFPHRPLLATLLSLIGMHGQLKSSPFWKRLITDKDRYKVSLSELASLSKEQILLSHGRLILKDGQSAFNEALRISV